MKKQLLAVAAAAAIMIGGGVVTAAPATAASLNGSVKGHIRSFDGKGLAGANVLVSRVGGSTVLKTDVTSKTGRYEMALKPGSYTLIASDPKDKYATSTFATTFTVETGVADRVNKRLYAASSITGRVTSDSGARLAGVTVTATGTNTAGAALPVETRTTNSAGAFYLRGLSAGTYTVKYAKTDYITEYFGGGTGTPVTVGIGEKRTGTGATLSAEGKITGRAFVNGVPADTELGGVVAKLTDKATGTVVETQTVNPTFKFKGLPAGVYTLSFAGADGVSYIPSTGYPTDITLAAGQASSGLVQQLTTTPGAVLPTKTTATVVPAAITAGAETFTVSVKTKSYGALTGVPVTLSYDGSVKQTAALDASGAANFTVDSSFWVGKPGKSVGAVVDVLATPTTGASSATVYPNIR